MSTKDSKTEQPCTLQSVNGSIDVPPVRVRYWNYRADEQEDGTVIDQTKTHYIVIPDINLQATVRWPKMDCNVLR